jgi:hypothetical protein
MLAYSACGGSAEPLMVAALMAFKHALHSATALIQARIAHAMLRLCSAIWYGQHGADTIPYISCGMIVMAVARQVG